MEKDTVLQIEKLSKKFCRTLKRSLFYGTTDIVRSMLGINYDTGTLRKAEFWALDDVNFDLKRGETLGIVGVNGSGKSTLLRLITGIFPPDKGRIAYKGKIGALIAVGAGFHPHMTGRENIYLNGTILGMTKNEINKKFDEIVDFADIGDFLEAPVSTYSSGMTVRLGFSIAVHCEPDILLVDEILAVGDVGFQLKCLNKIGELKAKNTSTILISHNLHIISTFCERVIVMHQGEILHNGDLSVGISKYKSIIEALKSEGEIEKVNTGTEYFNIFSVDFKPQIQNNTINLKTGQDLQFTIEYESYKTYSNIEVDIVIRLPFPTPNDYFQATNKSFNKKLDIKKGKGQITGVVRSINLNDTRAYLFIAVWENNRRNLLLWWRNIPLFFEGNNLSQGWSIFETAFFNNQ